MVPEASHEKKGGIMTILEALVDPAMIRGLLAAILIRLVMIRKADRTVEEAGKILIPIVLLLVLEMTTIMIPTMRMTILIRNLSRNELGRGTV